jgi:hypothetical protein
MSTKKALFAMLALVALAACSKDVVLQSNQNEIRYNVVAENTTKASDVYCNNNMPGSFNVYANYDGNTYIDNDVIVKQTDGSWLNTSGVRYWPATGDVTFFAHVNAGTCFEGGDAPQIKDFTVPAAVADQQDLLYAVKSQAKGNTPVNLNFRHALSQVVFQAKNTNSNLYVEVSGVTVCNVGNTNTFTYPTADTDANIENHTGAEGTVTYGDSWGTWAALAGGETDYQVAFDAVALPCASDAKSLTNTNDTGKEFSSNAMLLLPQTTVAWDPATETSLPDASGSYFLVNCKIWNVAGDAWTSTDVLLHEGPAAIPAAFSWQQGKKYVYTFVFGNGNGGYDPTDPSKPVLVPIDFEITVDDFVPVANQDYEMTK